jgi:hypothetical protein
VQYVCLDKCCGAALTRLRVMSVIQAAKNKMDPRCAEVSIYTHTHTYIYMYIHILRYIYIYIYVYMYIYI